MPTSDAAKAGGKGTKADLVAAIPNLRAFAVSLCGNADRADDLVQETLVKAWSNLASFTEGTNLTAWLFTILRNIHYSDFRKRRREAPIRTAPSPRGWCRCRRRTPIWTFSISARRCRSFRSTSARR